MIDVAFAPDKSLLIRIERLEEENETLRQKLEKFENEAKAHPLTFPSQWHLSPQQSAILNVLMKKEWASSEALFESIPHWWSSRDDTKIIAVQTCRLRKKLKPVGVLISSIWGAGYSILPEHKALVRAAIEARQ